MRSFFVICAAFLFLVLSPGVVLAAKSKPKKVVPAAKKIGPRFPLVERSDLRGGRTVVLMRPASNGDSAWFFTPCAAKTKGILPAMSGKPVGVTKHQFSCVLPGEVRTTLFTVSCTGRLSNSSAMYTGLDPSKPFFQISLECSS